MASISGHQSSAPREGGLGLAGPGQEEPEEGVAAEPGGAEKTLAGEGESAHVRADLSGADHVDELR